ncbi:MAG: hypothetical protein A2Z16_13015 [Chloroflexi bacterium RBG_16_54_18]|nr:MAG: hypothetical protein A2Z16_13015 [Chloroflexi bacterium RBG_16_54_18]
MKLTDIPHLRLYNQHIRDPLPGKPEDVVSWLCAVQAQDYAGAKWSLGLRLQNASDAEIEQAFAAGSILRTHLLRPTWHFVTPEDIRWLLMLTAPRVHAVNASMYRKLELDSTVFTQCNKSLATALQGGWKSTRDELRDVLLKAGIEVHHGQRLAYIMMNAELEGLVCSGGRRGRQFTYALLDERAPNSRILLREEALSELARRYFTSRGPATVHDFSKWSGLTLTDARGGLENIQTGLHQELVNGQVYWFSEPTLSAAENTHVAYLLSVYDEYISSYKDHSPIAAPEVGSRLAAMGNALQNIIVLDSHIAGTWRRILTKHAVVIEVNPFSILSDSDELRLADAARRFGEFVGLPVEMR